MAINRITRSLLIIICVLTVAPLSGQVIDDFSDGDFTDGSPLIWVASQTSGGNDFVITSEEVQSNGPATYGDLYLSTNLGIDYANNDVVWTFRARYDGGAPSGSNRIEIFLISDIEDISGDPSGYYIGMGESGSSDGIDFFKTGNSTAIINDDNDLVGSGIDIHVRVTRSSVGLWTVEADASGGNAFTEIGTVTDTDFTSGDYFGFYVQHTSTRFDDFFFDDFSITTTPLTDTDPPTIQSVTAISDTQVDVQFSEDLDHTTSQNIANYALDGSITVNSAVLDTDNSLVHLTTDALTNGETYTLTINNIEDTGGNIVAADSEVSFEYLVHEEADEYDVVINEFMAAPGSGGVLPNAEYVELYNKSSKFINLEDWTISDAAGSSSVFNAVTLRPEEFLILTSTGNEILFNTYGDVLGVSGFPSLNNGGDEITITNESAFNIHQISYADATSQVSTELINPNGPDYSSNNYGLSTDPDGGTPGKQNSIFDDTPDITPPSITSVNVVSNTELDVIFDEVLEETSAETIGNYTIDGGIMVSTASKDDIDNTLIHLTVSALVSGEMRTLTVNGVEDLSGNQSINETIQFEYIETEEAEANDVVVNEFLASPNAASEIPSVEFVELYNRSSKFIDLENWKLSDAAGSSSSFDSHVFRPGEYLILTETDNGDLFESYGDVLEIDGFPSLNNGGDSILLENSNEIVIFETAYASSTGGISTELINPNGPDYSSNNYGLSTDPDGGTPGKQNSIFDDTPDITPPSITSVNVVSNTELDVIFDEVLEETSAETIGNYTIDGGITVSTASKDDIDNTLIHLTVSALVSGEMRTLTVNGVEDLSGNQSINETIQFEYIETEEAEVNDVVVNEFLADPIPSMGLPEAEFVELFNRSDKNINLMGWQLDGSQIESFVLKPNEYVLLADDSKLAEFSAFERIIGIASLSLSNDEDRIVLTNSTGLEIHTIFYEESISGITKELINPNDPCLSSASYIESVNSIGGTPGAQNSVFDDTPDTQSPQIQSYNYGNALTITFSEVMDSLSLIAGSYSVSNNLTIDQIIVDGESPRSVGITFKQQLVPGIFYELSIANVSDCPGNLIEETTIVFGIGRAPTFNDLIITEIMFDPDPQIALPAREFIEIYNGTSEILSTNGVMLTDATETVEVPDCMINPGEFYVLTSTAAVTEFEGNVIGVPGFPSLNNTGEPLIFTHEQSLVFSVNYNPKWHDIAKVDGGYSLEMKDLKNPCLETNNWGSSRNVAGGTPGLPNSVSENFPDNFPPKLMEAVAHSADSISITFDEKIHPETQEVALLEVSTIEIGDTYFDPFNPKKLIIALNQNLEESKLYTLTASGVLDCSGNSSNEGSVQFALPVKAKKQEIKLSEVLFNPRSNGVDFVEIVNTSENYISLKNWKLASQNEIDEVEIPKIITTEELVIDPGQYLVLTTDKEILLTNYPKGEFKNFIEVTSIPTYPNEEGTVVLVDSDDAVVDAFTYHEDYHYDLLESVDGVSLERVSFNEPTNNPDNWRSASSEHGFATPGYANSQSFTAEVPSGKISASPEVFIPGNAGTGRDFTTINYQLDSPGQFANVNIYDQNGRLVKHLAQGVLLSTSGFIRWDGDTNSGQMARMGYYLIIFEIYDSSGSSEIIKETVVVGRDF